LKLTFQTNTVLNVKKCKCWCLSVITRFVLLLVTLLLSLLS